MGTASSARQYRVDRRKIQRRIRATFKNGETVYAYAKRTHVDPQNIYNYFKGRNSIGLVQLVRIARATGRSMDWLVGLK